MLFWICSYREISAALSWTPPKCRATADGERALARGTRQHRPVSSPRQCTGSGLIEHLKSQQRYWHDCNGCDLDVGRQLGADQVLVAWVNRVSALILTLTYEIHGVRSGQILARKSFDFRGDSDLAWTHAIRYRVRDLQEHPTAHQNGS